MNEQKAITEHQHCSKNRVGMKQRMSRGQMYSNKCRVIKERKKESNFLFVSTIILTVLKTLLIFLSVSCYAARAQSCCDIILKATL